MSDFAYDSEDFTAMRVATRNLQQTETTTLMASTGAMLLAVGYHWLTRHHPNSLWQSSRLLVFGSTGLASALGYI